MTRTSEHGPRHVAVRRTGGRPVLRRRAPRHVAETRHETHHAARGASTRTLLAATALLALGTGVVLTGTGSTFALWTASSEATGPTLVSGSTGLTINGETDHVLAGLGLGTLAPGQSVLAPLTLRNTGTTPVGVRVAGTAVTADVNGLAGSLAVSVTPVTPGTSCAAQPPGAEHLPLDGFSTPSPLSSLAPGAELAACLEVRLDLASPSSVQGGSAGFVMTFEATQERSS